MVPANTNDHPFGDLTPELFVRDTSAISTTPHDPHWTQRGLTRGPLGFRLFIRRCLDGCDEQLRSDDPIFRSQAVLSGPEFTRLYHGEEDEFPSHFADRLRREATAMNASWSFVAMLAPFRIREPDAAYPPVDPDDQDAVQAAIERGEMQSGMIWSASRHEDGVTSHAGGVVFLDDNGWPQNEVTGNVEPDTDPFRHVLHQEN